MVYSDYMPILASNMTFSLLMAFIIVLAYIAIHDRDKYNKTQDELLSLADKMDFFQKKPSIMRRDEWLFYEVITRLYGEKYTIFPQVRLSDIITVKENIKDHDNLYREIDHRSIDFAFFDNESLSPILAVELNGASHFQMNRKNRDQKISNILTKAGIQFIAIPVQEKYNEEEIQKLINLFLLKTT